LSNNIATKRYAQAIFDIGQGKGQAALEQIGRDLGALKDCLDTSPSLANLFASPVFSNDEKAKVLSSLMEKGGIEQIVKDFCLLLLEKGRLPILAAIAETYRNMLDHLAGIVKSELITAIELAPETPGRNPEKPGSQSWQEACHEFQCGSLNYWRTHTKDR
jgi:F0F1-type ATP synthase, delta subunit (mitochondrial oligomycin sensitivity protein)